ncbi:M48 family metalloprotease [Pseudomonas tolaasii]|uniref:Zn-dependent protease with chaperone function n=1 Tax=Pseudomonas tolaasii NCPPB 2192 TaxID=564423 RepID=A0ABX4QLN7_PSETO|nr:M48 family metalloprotease [Pseudomonas tolaasii]ARB30491.1 hydrolase [Pseudomonas tolaasii]KAB0466886.1 M48 family metalloprotease [Pseudomonas tolaasii]MBW1247904.1 M48 family metalloprotease [Pseudomonas tolaasii]MBW4792860.1 M48 family metalloprotease [Pseudomonas tolaasii]MBY8939142.1 M48 family metalloprotease [Pseudomonas tolaasii]
MSTPVLDISSLTPLPYHQQVVNHLKANEPAVWSWASSLGVQQEHAQDVRAQLLRDTYRLSPETHPQAYQACETALQRLQIRAPATLYQAADGAMNASLYYLAGEVHVVFYGPILERLDSQELLALLGHELAHYRLWSEHEGDYLTAERILNHAMADMNTPPSLEQTARLYSLHTEIYADRGAALVAGGPEASITSLVKVHTGIVSVDAGNYLQQARELDVENAQLSQGVSHPETFLRSQAVDSWWQQLPQTDAWLHKRLRGPLSLSRLDVTDQVELTALTRGFMASFIDTDILKSEAVLNQVRGFFPDWQGNETPLELGTLNAERIDASIHEYLHFIMLDLSLVDRDVRDEALLHAARMARKLGSADDFISVLKRDIKLPKRELDPLVRALKAEVDTWTQ